MKPTVGCDWLAIFTTCFRLESSKACLDVDGAHRNGARQAGHCSSHSNWRSGRRVGRCGCGSDCCRTRADWQVKGGGLAGTEETRGSVVDGDREGRGAEYSGRGKVSCKCGGGTASGDQRERTRGYSVHLHQPQVVQAHLVHMRCAPRGIRLGNLFSVSL